MEKALNLNNESIRPTYTGQRAICEVCGSAVISKCGTIYPYHWAHKNNKDCDPWYEPKTAWHKKWQDYFPEYQQEIVVKKNDIYHRADILTQNGIIIEIQNSPISVEILKEREDFYQNMIWIVNGDKFKNNLTSINLLKQKLKELDLKSDFLVRKVSKNKSISFMNSKLIYYISYNKYFIEQLKINTNDIAQQKNNLFFLETATIQDSINLIYSEYYSELYIYDTILKDFKSKRQYCLTEIKTFKKILNDLLNLPEHIIDGVSYRESIFIKLDLARFKYVKALLKNDYNSLFKNYISFDSETELIYKNNKYDLVYFCDLNYLICDIEKRISDLNNIMSLDQIEYDRILNIVKSNTIKSINESIIKSIENMNNNKLKYINNLFIIVKLKRHIRRLKVKHNTNKNNSIKIILHNSYIKRNKIVNKYKNLYIINWKWKRQAWDIANKPVYFDFGYDFLLLKIGKDLYKKVTIVEFLKLHIADYNILNSINITNVYDHSENIEKIQTVTT